VRRSIFSFILSFILVGAVGLIFWPGAGTLYATIDVKSGMTARDVLSAMQTEGLLQSSYPYLIWTRLRGAGPKIKLGRYRLSYGRSAFWLVDDLIQGRTQKVTVTIPEGFASWQIAERLEESKVCGASAFKQVVAAENLEGFLFPATYELDFGLAPQAIARKMAGALERHWGPDLERQAKSFGWGRKEALTMASIVQREAMDKGEMPLIAAVYHNRLRKNMFLQADPTVQFSLGYWKSRLTYDDYKNVQSPYNTYLRNGLPPGPICSPGADAIRAALFPATSDALYLVATGDGHHSFSTSYREHANKVNQRDRQKRQNRAAKPVKR